VHTRCMCVRGGWGRACAPRFKMWDGTCTHLQYVCCRQMEFRIFISMRYFVWKSRALCCCAGKCVYTHNMCVQYVCVWVRARRVLRGRVRVHSCYMCICVCNVCARACAPGSAPSAAGESKCILAMCVCVCVQYAQVMFVRACPVPRGRVCVHTCYMHLAFIGRFAFSMSHVCSSVYRAPCAAARENTRLHSQYVCVCVRARLVLRPLLRESVCVYS